MSHKLLFLVVLMAPAFGLRAESIAFIGSPLSAELSKKSCEEYSQPKRQNGLEEICMSRAFILKYKVNKLLLGVSKEPEIEFIGFYHYRGLPDFTSFDPALVILQRENDNLMLKNITYVVERDSGWSYCVKENPNEEGDYCLEWATVETIINDYR